MCASRNIETSSSISNTLLDLGIDELVMMHRTVTEPAELIWTLVT
jgi:hypothetical protein